jgi:hypothetical protein
MLLEGPVRVAAPFLTPSVYFFLFLLDSMVHLKQCLITIDGPHHVLQDIALQIKANLQKAQDRMKLQADKHRQERQLEVGDMVYLKLQPYRHTSLSIHICLKLNSRYYGPFRVLARIGNTSYKIVLPEGCHLRHTFHVSQLKKHLGPKSIPCPHLSLLNPNGTILIAPEQILERKLIPKMQGGISIHVVQWLIK